MRSHQTIHFAGAPLAPVLVDNILDQLDMRSCARVSKVSQLLRQRCLRKFWLNQSFYVLFDESMYPPRPGRPDETVRQRPDPLHPDSSFCLQRFSTRVRTHHRFLTNEVEWQNHGLALERHGQVRGKDRPEYELPRRWEVLCSSLRENKSQFSNTCSWALEDHGTARRNTLTLHAYPRSSTNGLNTNDPS